MGHSSYLGHSSYYREQADHARRLADITTQQNLEEALRRIAEEFDHLAADIATGEFYFSNPEIPEGY
jgi:hypothetical protein